MRMRCEGLAKDSNALTGIPEREERTNGGKFLNQYSEASPELILDNHSQASPELILDNQSTDPRNLEIP